MESLAATAYEAVAAALTRPGWVSLSERRVLAEAGSKILVKTIGLPGLWRALRVCA